jgi:hypothetical protein
VKASLWDDKEEICKSENNTKFVADCDKLPYILDLNAYKSHDQFILKDKQTLFALECSAAILC